MFIIFEIALTVDQLYVLINFAMVMAIKNKV